MSRPSECRFPFCDCQYLRGPGCAQPRPPLRQPSGTPAPEEPAPATPIAPAAPVAPDPLPLAERDYIDIELLNHARKMAAAYFLSLGYAEDLEQACADIAAGHYAGNSAADRLVRKLVKLLAERD